MRTMFKNYLKLLLCFGVLAASWMASPEAMAQTYWSNAANGDWSVASNWSNGVPTATTQAFITVTATPFTITVPAGTHDALAVKLSANATLQLTGDLKIGSTLFVSAQSPITGNGKLWFEYNGTAIGDVEIERSGGGIVDIPNIGVTGSRSVAFSAAAGNVTSGNITNAFISANSSPGQDLGILLKSTNSTLNLVGGGKLDYDGSNTGNVNLGGVNASQSASVTVGAGTFDVNEVSGLDFATVTVVGNLILNGQLNMEDAANMMNILRLTGDLTNNVAAGNPVLGTTATHGYVIFSNLNQAQRISGQAFTLAGMEVNHPGTHNVNLEANLTLNGSITNAGFTTILNIANGGDLNIASNTVFTITPPDDTYNNIFATSNPVNNVLDGRITGEGFMTVNGANRLDMGSHFAIEPSLQVSGTGGGFDMSPTDNEHSDAFSLYLSGKAVGLANTAPFGFSGTSFIQFYDNRDASTADAQVITNSAGAIGMPYLQVAKNNGNVTFTSTVAAGNFVVSTAAPTTDAGLTFVSSDLDNFSVTGNLAQLVVNNQLTFATAAGVSGIYDQTDGKGEVSGSGNVITTTASFISATPRAGAAFAMGANLDLNGNGMDLRSILLNLGGSLLGNGFITTGNQAPAHNNEGVSFVTVNGIASMADAGTATGGADALNIGTLVNVKLQRDMVLGQTLFISADAEATAGAAILTFDGGSFVDGVGKTVFISAGGDAQVISQTGNNGGFNVSFISVAYADNADIALQKAAPGDFSFGLADVFITGGAIGTPGTDGIIDAETDTDIANVVFGGDVTYNGPVAPGTPFINVGAANFVEFDIAASNAEGRGLFLTATRTAAGGLDFERLKVKGANGFNGAANLQCFDNSPTQTGEGLVLTTATHVVGSPTGGVIVDLSERGNIFVSSNGTLALTGTARPANIALPTDGTYAAITGDGNLTLNPTLPAAGQWNGFTPSDGKVLIGTALSGHLELNSELALAGDLLATIAYSSNAATGIVRMVGSNSFQTVAPGVLTALGAGETNMGFIPNLIVDKCVSTTAFISTGWNMVIGQSSAVSGNNGFISVNSGILDLNSFVTVHGGTAALSGKPVTANAAYGNSFITTSQDATIAGFNLSVFAGAAPISQFISASGTAGFTTVYIPNLKVNNSNVTLSNTNIAVFNTATTSVDYALELNGNGSAVPIPSIGGNLDLGGNKLFITGGGSVTVRQPSDATNPVILEPGSVTSTGSNSYTVMNGETVVTGLQTVMFITSHPAIDAAATVSRFTVNNLVLTDGGGINLNNNVLEVTGNMTHNSFATAFVTTAATSGMVSFSGTNAALTFQTAELQIPSVKVNNTLTLGGTAGSDLVVGKGRALSAFTSVLEIGTSLNIANNFMTISGDGGMAGGSVDGGTKDPAAGGAVRIEAFTTVSGGLTFSSAGVEFLDGSNTVAGQKARIDVRESVLTFGGNIYEQTTATTYGDAFITGDPLNGLVNFTCPAGGNPQFISSDGGQSAIMTNVYVNNNLGLGDPTAGINATDVTFNNVDFILGGTGTAADKAALTLNNAKLALGFNSVTILAGGGALHNLTSANDRCSMLGFGTVYVKNGINGTAMITVATNFGIGGDLISQEAAQINLNAKTLYLGGDYANGSTISKTFVTATGNDASALELTGKNDCTSLAAFQTVSIVGSFGGTATYTEIPHLRVNGAGTQLASGISLYGGGHDALHLMTAVHLNGNFITVTNEGTAINAVWADSDAKLIGLNTGNSDGLYFSAGAAGSTNLTSNLTIEEAALRVNEGRTLNMTTVSTLSVGGDITSFDGTTTGTIAAGGAKITASGTDNHAWVKFISAAEPAGEFDLHGIAQLPAFELNVPGSVAKIFGSPANFTSVTSNSPGDVLSFTAGHINLEMTTVTLTGTGDNSIADNTASQGQVFITASTGSVWIAGSGTTTLKVPNNNSAATSPSMMINPGHILPGTYFPSLKVAKTDVTKSVDLSGNIFISTNLAVTDGDLDLKGNNIQFLTAGELNEDAGSGDGDIIVNSGATNYPDDGKAYTPTGTKKQPQGVVFATAAAPASAAQTLGLSIAGSGYTSTKIELRKDLEADGTDVNGSKINIGRNYKVIPTAGAFTPATTALTMHFAKSEIGSFDPVDLGFITFGGGPNPITPNEGGFYSNLSGTTGDGTNNLAFNTIGKSLTNGLPANAFSGYITLGVSTVNIFHNDGVADKDPSGIIDPKADESGTVGEFRIVNASRGTDFSVQLEVVAPPVSAAQPELSGDGRDYFVEVFAPFIPGNPWVAQTAVFTDNRFSVRVPAGQTTTKVRIVAVDDELAEGNEFLTVAFSGAKPTAPGGGALISSVVLGNFSTASLTILDNDTPGFDIAKTGTDSKNDAADTVSVVNFITVDEKLKMTENIAVRLRQEPKPGTKVYMVVTLSDGTEAQFAGVKLADGTATDKFTGALTGTAIEIPFATGGADEHNWSDFVTISIKGKNDFDPDPGVGVSDPKFSNVVGANKFDVTFEISTVNTTDPGYINPSSLDPSNVNLPDTIGKVTVNGVNMDDEDAIRFKITQSGTDVREDRPHGQDPLISSLTQTLFVSVSQPPLAGQPVTINFGLDASRGTAARGKIDGVTSLTFKSAGSADAGEVWSDPQTITLAAVDNDVDERGQALANGNGDQAFFITVTSVSSGTNMMHPTNPL